MNLQMTLITTDFFFSFTVTLKPQYRFEKTYTSFLLKINNFWGLKQTVAQFIAISVFAFAAFLHMATPSACIASLAEVQLTCSSAAVSLSPGTVLGTSVQQQLHFLYSSKPFSCHFALHICSSFGCLLVVLEFDFCVSYITCNICVPRILIPDSFCSFKSSRTLVMIVGWHSDAFISLFGHPTSRKGNYVNEKYCV